MRRLVSVLSVLACGVAVGGGVPARAATLPGVGTATGELRTHLYLYQDYDWGPWQFTGTWTAGAKTFVGKATGSISQGSLLTAPLEVPPFSLTSISGRGSLSGTCSGTFTGTEVVRMTCSVSVSGSAPTTIHLVVPLVQTSSTFVDQGTDNDYIGAFTTG